MKDSRLELLTDKNSALVLVDYQPAMFKGVGSGNRSSMLDSAVGAARAAALLQVPVVLSSIYPQGNGDFLKDITENFPKVPVYSRKIPGFDAFDDEDVWGAVKRTGRKKLVIGGLWTSMCFCYTAIHGVREGYDVYGLVDAAGDASPEAHKFGIKRMIQAGVVPITCLSLISEWMHDWNNPKAGDLKKKAYGKFDSMMRM